MALYFAPKLTHAAVEFGCDSWTTCQLHDAVCDDIGA